MLLFFVCGGWMPYGGLRARGWVTPWAIRDQKGGITDSPSSNPGFCRYKKNLTAYSPLPFDHHTGLAGSRSTFNRWWWGPRMRHGCTPLDILYLFQIRVYRFAYTHLLFPILRNQILNGGCS